MKDNFVLHFDTMPKGTAQQKGVYVLNGKPRFYVKEKIESARRQFIYALKPHAPKEPSDKCIKLTVHFFFDVKDKSKWGKWKPSRPDADGIIKEFLDAMGDCRFFKNDSQVVDLRVRKSYAGNAEIFVVWEELGDRP